MAARSRSKWPRWRCRRNRSGKSGRVVVQTRYDLQNQAIGWLRKGCRSFGGGTAVNYFDLGGYLGIVDIVLSVSSFVTGSRLRPAHFQSDLDRLEGRLS